MSHVQHSPAGGGLIQVLAGRKEQVRLTCAMRWYSPSSGYGFAIPLEGGDEVMVHSCVLARDGFLVVAEGAVLDIEAVRTIKGLQALMVYSLDLSANRTDVLAKRERTVVKREVTVRWYNETKGYGFAFVENGSSDEGDIFLHAEVVRRAGLNRVCAGERLSVLVAPGERGLAVRTIYVDAARPAS